MALSHLEVFKNQVYTGVTETVAQEVNKFNAASNGTITLASDPSQGDYNEETQYKKITGLVRRRDVYASGAVSAVDLEHLLDRGVKVGAGTAPVNIDPSFMSWIQRGDGEAAAVIATQLAEDMIADKLNIAIGVYVSALRNADSGSGVYMYDGGAGTASLSTLNQGAALFGDRSSSIGAWIMHSKSLHDIYGTALTNSERLFQFGTVNVMDDGFGRPLIQTDSSYLQEAGSPNGYYQLGLVAGGIMVKDNGDFLANIETTNGDNNIGRTYQAEWTYNIGIKGYAWNTSAGASPTDAELVTAGNWTQFATDVKDTAGVLVLTR